jgi:hypothetical protein
MSIKKKGPRGANRVGPSVTVLLPGELPEDNRNPAPLQLRSRRYFAEALATAGATSFAALALAHHFGRSA